MKKIKTRNKWFLETFLPSFGMCNGKHISEKQGEIFKRYLNEEERRYSNAYYYTGIAKGLMIEVQESSAYNGSTSKADGRRTLYRTVYFLSIKEDTTEKERELKSRIKENNEMWKKASVAGANDKELNRIEEIGNELLSELNRLRSWNI